MVLLATNPEVFAFLAALLVGLLHFFGEELEGKIPIDSLILKSFSAGFTIAYFFLSMLPEIFENSGFELSFFWVLAGFSLFYVIEEVIYSSSSHMSEVKREFKELHSVFLTLYHGCIGLLIYFLAFRSIETASLFVLPVIGHTFVNSLSIKQLHEEMLQKSSVKFLASSSPILGFLIAKFTDLGPQVSYSIFGLVGGMFIYLVIHDSLSPRKERPLGYLLGVFAFLAIIGLI